jgi:heavy metal efflux system protein
MIRALVDFALKSRWLVLIGVVVLVAWGVVSFRNLPIEAYPDWSARPFMYQFQ